MTRDACYSLDINYPLSRYLLPLRYGLWSDPILQSPRQPGIPSHRGLGPIERCHLPICQIFHDILKALLSINCKQNFQ